MKILVLSFYYPPDLSAGSFRVSAFVKALQRVLGENVHIEVLTTIPNRYATYQTVAAEREVSANVTVRRFKLPSHRSGLFDQSRAFAAFAVQVIRHVRTREYDLVFATTSRLMTGFLGARIANRFHVPFLLDVRDIFLDTIKDLYPGAIARLVGPLVGWMERRTINRATKINLVSEGFFPYFRRRYPSKDFTFIPNGIDEGFDSALEFSNNTPDGAQIILYAGNIGAGQGLDKVVPGLARALGSGYEFWIVGDGGRRSALERAIEQAGVENVRILAPVERSELITLYRRSDFLFLHLDDVPAFEKVLPSKIFEYAATGKPILAGVAGYAADFLRTEVPNVGVFPPGDVPKARVALAGLTPGMTDRTKFRKDYDREVLSRKLACELRALLEVGTE